MPAVRVSRRVVSISSSGWIPSSDSGIQPYNPESVGLGAAPRSRVIAVSATPPAILTPPTMPLQRIADRLKMG